MENKQNLASKVRSLALATALGVTASQANATPIINFTTIGSGSYAIGLTFDTQTTEFTLPTGLTSISQLTAYAGGESYNWDGVARMNNGFVEIFYSGPTINPNISGIFAYDVNRVLDLTEYNTTNRVATIGGPDYDYTNNQLQITTVDLSSPINQEPANPVPEPNSGALLGLGLAGILASRKFNKKNN